MKEFISHTPCLKIFSTKIVFSLFSTKYLSVLQTNELYSFQFSAMNKFSLAVRHLQPGNLQQINFQMVIFI